MFLHHNSAAVCATVAGVASSYELPPPPFFPTTNSDVFANILIAQLGSLSRSMLSLSTADPAAALAPASMRIIVQIASLTLSLNAGSGLAAGALAHIAVLSVGAAYRADTAGGSVIHARLGELALLDALEGDAAHPLLLSRALPDAAHRASAAPLLVARIALTAPLAADAPLADDLSSPLRIDTDVSLTLSPLRYVHVHSTLMSVIEYATTGLLGTLLMSSAQLAGDSVAAAAEAAAAAESRLHFAISLGGIAVLLPSSRTSHRSITGTLGAVELANSFSYDTSSTGGHLHTAATMEITILSVAGLSLFAAGAHGGTTAPAPLLAPTGMRARVVKAKGKPLEVSLDFPGAELTVAPQLVSLLMSSLDGNMGAKTDSRASVTAVALASGLLEEGDDAHEHDDGGGVTAAAAAAAAPASAPPSIEPTPAPAASASASAPPSAPAAPPDPSSAIHIRFKVPGAISVCLADEYGTTFAAVSLSAFDLTAQLFDGRVSAHAACSLALAAAEARDTPTLTNVITGCWPLDVQLLIRRADDVGAVSHTALIVAASKPLTAVVSEILLSRLLGEIAAWMAIALPMPKIETVTATAVLTDATSAIVTTTATVTIPNALALLPPPPLRHHHHRH